MQNLLKTGTQFIFLFVLFGALTISAGALTFTVNSTANNSDAATADNLCDTDAATAGNQCTLRAAIQQANVSTGADTINFDATLFASAQTILLSSALPQITGDSTITGISPTLIIIDGNGNSRVFNVASGVTVGISNLTVTNGFVGESSGGALNGAGIYNTNGAVTLDNSTISGNTAGGIGGGYYGFANLSATTLTATASTIASNTAATGGGVAVSTAVGSSAANIGNTIIGDNTASDGPDIYSSVALIPSEGKQSAKYSAAANLGVSTGVISAGYNLVENTSGGTSVSNPLTDRTGDPGLLPLADNGGLTLTHALESTSQAIDKGNSTGTDQRGVARPIDNPGIAPAPGWNDADIGAYEAPAAPTAASVTIGGRIMTNAGRGIGSARVVLVEADGTRRYAATNSFGYYRFESIAAGQTATIEVRSKRYQFAPQVVNVSGK
jgi:hypothetical protein